MKYSNDWAEGYTKICKSTTAIVYYYHSLHTAFEARPIYYSQANHPTGALDTIYFTGGRSEEDRHYAAPEIEDQHLHVEGN